MIRIEKLWKSFGRLDVLRDLDLQIETGSVTALVGHNGSGKTTLIKCILGLDRLSRGAVHFQGKQLNGEVDHRQMIGYMPQLARFPENLTAGEILDMISDLRGNPRDARTELIEYFGLQTELEKSVRVLSGGNRQKVSMVIAFMFDPEFLILDEPTAGLDPLASSLLKDRIQTDRDAGKTFLITSHMMSELEELADHIVYLHDGRIVYQGTILDLIADNQEPNLERAIARLMRAF